MSYNCPTCGRLLDVMAPSCPGCGYVLPPYNPPKATPAWLAPFFVVGICAFAIFVF